VDFVVAAAAAAAVAAESGSWVNVWSDVTEGVT